jgi:aspartate/methionine/tyrosine aminotransferase
MRIDTDGRMWAINPEKGFFGVAPGTNRKSNPNMMKTMERNTIYTNVVLKPDGTVWWEGHDDPAPAEGIDWQGRPWTPDMKDADGKPVVGAHANSRATAPISQCPSSTFRLDHHHGVPISAIIFGGRRAHLAPLVYESFDWEHGVFVGATMASERTAAQVGKIGEVRRDPMAMLPFCGYHMGDYFEHWIETGRRMKRAPKIFHVNWFRQDENGKFLWPGFGENLRVIEWILARCRGEADAVETPIGYVPTADGLDLTGLDITGETVRKVLSVNAEDWKQDADQTETFFQSFGGRFPKELWEQYRALRQRLEAPITFRQPGSVVRPLAAELNDVIARESTVVAEMLSGLGRRLYFPKGILAQSAEAKEKAHAHDATIGIAYEGGKPMALATIMRFFNELTPAEALTYAPPMGRPDLRKAWKDHLLAANPSLAGKTFSLPVVTSGVTHAISVVGDLFIDRDDVVLLPDKYWENYDLLLGARLQAQIATYPFFTPEDGFNVEGLRQTLASRVGAKTIVALNFPNNPTGYCLTNAEADAVADVLRDAAAAGCKLLVLTDDAYFGLSYGPDVLAESLFAKIAGAHPNLVAVKLDGPTKEEYVWGLRVGMLTISAVADLDQDALYAALEKKIAGAIRSAISNCAHASQSIIAKALATPTFADEQAAKKAILQARAEKVQALLTNPEYADLWDAYPFNAGYFMCLKLKGLDAETYRKHLLARYGVGVIADGRHDIRVAFSAVDIEKLDDLYSLLAQAARDLHAGAE